MDTLQIYFPWDDDFYTILKENGFGTGGFKFKALPLIYSDNTESTIKQPELRRKFVIRPELFGMTYDELDWEQTDKPNEPIIPAEKPLLTISSKGDRLIFEIVPRVNGQNEYHMEYSTMSSFGKMYSNWVNLYLPLSEFKILIKSLFQNTDSNGVEVDLELKTESKQNQREELDYLALPIIHYEFSLGSFEPADRLLRSNGFQNDEIPALVYDEKDSSSQKIMSPIAKVGLVHTTRSAGFENREPQFAIKIAQEKVWISRRGKKAKIKGIITYGINGNFFILNKALFVAALKKLIEIFKQKHPGMDLGL